MQIHELNNYGGELNNEAFVAVDNGNDTGKVPISDLFIDIQSEVDSINADLNARIDNIIAGGDAPSAAEIVDARYGAAALGGADYASLGDAIRGQATDLQDEIVSLQDEILTPVGDAQIFNKSQAEITKLWAITNGSVSTAAVFRSFKLRIDGGNGEVFSYKLYGNDPTNIGITQLCCCVSNSALVNGSVALQRVAGNTTYMRGGITLNQAATYLYVMFTFDTEAHAIQYTDYLKNNLLVTKGLLPQYVPANYIPYYVYEVSENDLSEALKRMIDNAYYTDEIDTETPIALTPATGVYDNNGILNTAVGVNATVDIDPSKRYLVSGYVYSVSQYPLFNELDANDNIIHSEFAGATASGAIYNFAYTPKTNAAKIIVNSNNVGNLAVAEVTYKTVNQALISQWNGKKIVWFGTSIPEGDLGANSYPYMISQITGATVYNEAVGSSGVHCRLPSRVSTQNPYGFMQSFKIASRCLGNSIDEMQWLIDHYDSDIFTERYEDITPYVSMILSRSYENKIGQYLTPGTLPDLFVFDMGHNDQFNGSLAAEDALYNQYGEYNTFSFHGAMNMLIQYIRDYDPYVPIVLIGEYTGVETDFVPAMQMQVAKDWNMPICKDWEKLGWTKTKNLKVTGKWELIPGSNRYTWDEDGVNRTITVFNRWIPDGVHPYTDGSNKALQHMANTIAEWLETIPTL